jgi:hypothetical protein
MEAVTVVNPPLQGEVARAARRRGVASCDGGHPSPPGFAGGPPLLIREDLA